jgi:hypothetical protein
LTVKENVSVAAPAGATKVGPTVFAPDSWTAGPAAWAHV